MTAYMGQNGNSPKAGHGTKRPKIFVLDTNIILHDYRAIHHFQENDIVIPVAVLEELDKFKKGHDSLNFNAREFMREIDRLSENRKFGTEGVPIGRHLGNIKIELSHTFTEDLTGCCQDDIPDHRRLATAMLVKSRHPVDIPSLIQAVLG